MLTVIHYISKNFVEVYLGDNKNIQSVTQDMKIHYLYFFLRYLLLHSPSI